jgi:hypothetical protein
VIILRHDNINQVAASTMYHPPPISHYTTQVVLLLDQCRTKLQRLLDEAPRRSRSLLKLNKCLASIDTLLLSYLQGAMEDDGTSTSSKEARSSPQALEILKESSHARASTNAKNALQNPQDPAHHSHEQRSPLFENHSTKTAVDTLLFRLIVALELLLVRIDDANYVILGRRTDSELAITTAAESTNSSYGFTRAGVMYGGRIFLHHEPEDKTIFAGEKAVDLARSKDRRSGMAESSSHE